MGAAKRFIQNPGNESIAYYRYSSTAQRDTSIEQQREAAHAYAAKNNLKIIMEYEDHAITGTRDDRPEFMRMLQEVERLRPAYLILWKTDRLSRDKLDAAIAKGRLRNCGVKICYVAEAIPEGDEATEILIESLYEGMAAAFIATHRKNVMRGLSYNAENALYNGNKILGYTGKPDSKYEIDPKTAPIVRQIFSDYINGIPLKKICDDLNNKGFRSVRNNEFTINSLRRILQNRAYIGEYKWGKDNVVLIPDGMPAIVSEAVFNEAQLKLESNRRGGASAARKLDKDAFVDYWLTGHLYCGLCHETMQGVSGTSRNGSVFHYYYCKGHRNKKCALKNIRKDDIEEIVMYLLDELVNNSTLKIMLAKHCFERYQAEHSDRGALIESLEIRIKETENKIDNIAAAIEDGLYSKKLKENMKKLESQLSTLNTTLEAEKIRAKYDLKEADILRYFNAFEGKLNDPNKRNRILDILVDKIYVFDSEIVITFNYTDTNRTINISETMELINNQKKIFEAMDKIGKNPSENSEYLLDEEDPAILFHARREGDEVKVYIRDDLKNGKKEEPLSGNSGSTNVHEVARSGIEPLFPP